MYPLNGQERARINSDGTPLHANGLSDEREEDARQILEHLWNCELHHFGRLCPIDFYATRHGRLVAVLEIKTRDHTIDRYPTVFLNVRKWLALMLAQVGLGHPALFVVRFLDALAYLPIERVDATKIAINGQRHNPKSHTDVEPLIEVAISKMVVVLGNKPSQLFP